MKRFPFLMTLALASAGVPALASPQASSGAPTVVRQDINPQALHIALSSLLLAATKMAVENVMLKTGKPPASNRAAHVGEPDYLTTNEISSITVHPGGILEVHFTSAVSPGLTGVWLTPIRAHGRVEWTCVSHDIVHVHDVESSCTYQPLGR